MNLKDLLNPAPLLENQELEDLCQQLLPAGTWSITNGRINVTGSFDIERFIANGKLIAPFGEVTTMMLNVGNVHTLAGFPEIVHGVIDIRSQWLESLEGCPKITDSFYIEANHLKSLEHGPSVSAFYAVTSTSVASLVGISKKGIGTLTVGGCSSIKTTDGLDGVHLETLKLPPGIQEITEYPAHCVDIVYPICAGFPKLFLAEGLKTMSVSDISRKTKTSKTFVTKVANICKHVLSIEGSRRRYLEAQTLLIDSDLEELL